MLRRNSEVFKDGESFVLRAFTMLLAFEEHGSLGWLP